MFLLSLAPLVPLEGYRAGRGGMELERERQNVMVLYRSIRTTRLREISIVPAAHGGAGKGREVGGGRVCGADEGVTVVPEPHPVVTTFTCAAIVLLRDRTPDFLRGSAPLHPAYQSTLPQLEWFTGMVGAITDGCAVLWNLDVH